MLQWIVVYSSIVYEPHARYTLVAYKPQSFVQARGGRCEQQNDMNENIRRV